MGLLYHNPHSSFHRNPPSLSITVMSHFRAWRLVFLHFVLGFLILDFCASNFRA
ncbi:hypothetical protein LguiA_022085 [Lonicera macranthoides]